MLTNITAITLFFIFHLPSFPTHLGHVSVTRSDGHEQLAQLKHEGGRGLAAVEAGRSHNLYQADPCAVQIDVAELVVRIVQAFPAVLLELYLAREEKCF